MMKRYFLLLALGLSTCMASAQLIKQGDQLAKKQSDLDWYNCSFEEDGVYGAEINKAYEFLKGKKLIFKYNSQRKDKNGFARNFRVYECEDCCNCPYRSQCCKAKEGNYNNLRIRIL